MRPPQMKDLEVGSEEQDAGQVLEQASDTDEVEAGFRHGSVGQEQSSAEDGGDGLQLVSEVELSEDEGDSPHPKPPGAVVTVHQMYSRCALQSQDVEEGLELS